MSKKRFLTAALFSALLLMTAPSLTLANPGDPRGGPRGFDEPEFQGQGPQRRPGMQNQGSGPRQGRNQERNSQPFQSGPGQQNQGHQSRFMANLDRNGDGGVSRREFRGPDRLFSRLDRNNDGTIDSSESPQGPPRRDGRGGPGMMQGQGYGPPQGPGNQNGPGMMQGQGYGPPQGPGNQNGPGMMQGQGYGPPQGPGNQNGPGMNQGGRRDFMHDFDKDSSGSVSRDEFRGPDRLFARLDRNNDGTIDASEAPQGPPPGQGRNGQNGPGMTQGQGYGPPQGPGNQNGPGMTQGQGYGPPQGPGNQNGMEGPNQTGPRDFLADLDRDGNGSVSRNEFPGPEQMFSHLDKNHDGSIDSSEAPGIPQGPGSEENANE